MQEERTQTKRVRIADIAQELGLSTATVSNVIHGKTKKISEETVKRVQQLLEERQYIPSMAGILLAQNDSRIIGVIIQDCEKYGGRVLQDPFVYGSIDYLSESIKEWGYEMMLKKTCDCEEVVRYASMWNMSGLIMIGFCWQDYEKIRSRMHIPLVVYDGFFKNRSRFGNISIDNRGGGYEMGRYLIAMGHRNILYMADNNECMDQERYEGLCEAFREKEIPVKEKMLHLIPFSRQERFICYDRILKELSRYTAAFCASDQYAVEFMYYLEEHGIRVGKDFSVAGFDDIPLAGMVSPGLTTIHQDLQHRAKKAMELIELQKNGTYEKEQLSVCLPVCLKARDSVVDLCKSDKKRQ